MRYFPGVWYQSENINVYLRDLFKFHWSPSGVNFAYLDSALAVASRDYTKERLKYTYRRFKVLDYKGVITPVNPNGCHWTLLYISINHIKHTSTKIKLDLFDSMRILRSRTVATSLSYIVDWVRLQLEGYSDEVLGKVDIRKEILQLYKGQPIPQQTNSDDCGVFATMFGESILLDIPLIGQQDIGRMRFKMMHAYLKVSRSLQEQAETGSLSGQSSGFIME